MDVQIYTCFVCTYIWKPTCTHVCISLEYLHIDKIDLVSRALRQLVKVVLFQMQSHDVTRGAFTGPVLVGWLGCGVCSG